MSLAAVAARRMLLRRGAGALAALFVASGSRGDNIPTSGPTRGAEPVATPCEPDDYSARHAFAKQFYEQQNKIERLKWTKFRAWNEQDPDLKILLSTSPSWRASVMYDRLKAEQTVMDAIQKRLSQVWEEPMAKLQALVTSWVRGT